jgi:hypothetical protein
MHRESPDAHTASAAVAITRIILLPRPKHTVTEIARLHPRNRVHHSCGHCNQDQQTEIVVKNPKERSHDLHVSSVLCLGYGRESTQRLDLLTLNRAMEALAVAAKQKTEKRSSAQVALSILLIPTVKTCRV